VDENIVGETRAGDPFVAAHQQEPGPLEFTNFAFPQFSEVRRADSRL
jgi:hypothetical protein